MQRNAPGVCGGNTGPRPSHLLELCPLQPGAKAGCPVWRPVPRCLLPFSAGNSSSQELPPPTRHQSSHKTRGAPSSEVDGRVSGARPISCFAQETATTFDIILLSATRVAEIGLSDSTSQLDITPTLSTSNMTIASKLLSFPALTAISAIEAFFVSRLSPRCFFVYPKLVPVAGIFLLNYAVGVLAWVYVYPTFFSPTKHLPGPRVSISRGSHLARLAARDRPGSKTMTDTL